MATFLEIGHEMAMKSTLIRMRICSSGVQDPDFGVQSGRIFGFFGYILDIVSLSTGFGLSN